MNKLRTAYQQLLAQVRHYCTCSVMSNISSVSGAVILLSNWNSFPRWSVKIIERLIKGRACFQKSCIFHLNQIMSSWFLPLGQSLSQLVINNLTIHYAYVFILCFPQIHSVRLLTLLTIFRTFRNRHRVT